MGKAALFLGVGILVLLVIISLIVPQLNAAKQDVEEAEEFSQTVKQLLKAINVRCTASSSDFSAMENCIAPALRKNDFVSETFRPFSERKNETGVFVISNEGAQTYNGSLFFLSKNGADVAQGCHISSEILTDYTCRFDLVEPCTEGDVYEIRYGETARLVTKTC